MSIGDTVEGDCSLIAFVAPLRAAVVVLLGLLMSTDLLTGMSTGTSTGLLANAASARAGAGVELSTDRVSWADVLDAPVSLSGLAWQPGDVRASTFFVRNESAAGDLEVTLTRSGPTDPTAGPGPAATDVGITVTAVAGTAAETAVPADGEPHALTLGDLAPGQVVPVTVRAALAADVPLAAAADLGPIDVRAAVEHPAEERRPTGAESSPVAGATEDDWAGILTAAHLELAPVFLGFALILAAGAGWRRSRTRGRRG